MPIDPKHVGRAYGPFTYEAGLEKIREFAVAIAVRAHAHPTSSRARRPQSSGRSTMTKQRGRPPATARSSPLPPSA